MAKCKALTGSAVKGLKTYYYPLALKPIYFSSCSLLQIRLSLA